MEASEGRRLAVVAELDRAATELRAIGAAGTARRVDLARQAEVTGNVIPDSAKAETHREMAEPGSGKGGN